MLGSEHAERGRAALRPAIRTRLTVRLVEPDRPPDTRRRDWARLDGPALHDYGWPVPVRDPRLAEPPQRADPLRRPEDDLGYTSRNLRLQQRAGGGGEPGRDVSGHQGAEVFGR